MELHHDDLRWMDAALDEARLAADHDDVPVGAVIVPGGELIAAGHNERERLGDPTAHAELLAIRDAAAASGDGWRLLDAPVGVTVEPCAMCAGALLAARVGRLVFATPDLKAGACGSLYNLCTDPRLHHEITVHTGVRAAESIALLDAFFA